MDIRQLDRLVVMPVLRSLELNPKPQQLEGEALSARRLVIGTGLAESGFEHLNQIVKDQHPQVIGPAISFYQMERATHEDIWVNYLAYRDQLKRLVEQWLHPGHMRWQQMLWNMAYATAMCRVQYLRVKEKLPEPDNYLGLAEYWKEHYNTSKGKGTVENFLNHREQLEDVY
jgi:hypothetical protein